MDRCTENVIEWIENDKVATVTLSQRRHITKIRKLAEEHPEYVQILHNNSDGSICAHIPVSYIKFYKPQDVPEDRREKARELMNKLRSERGL